MSVEINIEYKGNLRCVATHTQSNSIITTDAPLDNGGKGEAFSPTDLVAAAVGTCIMTIMGALAMRKNIDLAGTKLHVTKEMASVPLRRIGEINVTVTLPKGLNLSDEDKTRFERSVNSCPVKQSLHPDVKVNSKFIY